MRKLAPELDPLRIGTGWKREDLSKPQIFIESTEVLCYNKKHKSEKILFSFYFYQPTIANRKVIHLWNPRRNSR